MVGVNLIKGERRSDPHIPYHLQKGQRKDAEEDQALMQVQVEVRAGLAVVVNSVLGVWLVLLEERVGGGQGPAVLVEVGEGRVDLEAVLVEGEGRVVL